MKIPVYVYGSMAFLWAWSGLQPMLLAPEWALNLLTQVGIPTAWQSFVFYVSASLDIALALAYLTPLKHKPMFYLFQLATVSAYSFIIAFRLPEMWLHPFAPLIKNLPILALLAFLFQQTHLEHAK